MRGLMREGGGVSSRSGVIIFVNHDSQKINFNHHMSRKYKKKSVEKQIRIAKNAPIIKNENNPSGPS